MSPFLDLVVTKGFPVLFNVFSSGPLPNLSPYNMHIGFTPYSVGQLSVLVGKIYQYYYENEEELLIFDDFSNLTFLDTFGNKGASVVDLKFEIWL